MRALLFDVFGTCVDGLTKLKETHIIAPCSNGHIAQSVNLAKFAKPPSDAILGAETARPHHFVQLTAR